MSRRYRLPQPLSTFEEWEAFENFDLLDLSAPRLRAELVRVRLALARSGERWLNATRTTYPRTWSAAGYLVAREQAIMDALWSHDADR